MAPAVTKLEIGFGIDSRLLEPAIGYQITAGGVEGTKWELLSLQVAERMDRRAGAGDEDRVKLHVRGTLDERDNSVPGMRLDIHQPTQAREIVRSICQAGNGLVIEGGNYKIHRLSHSLREIGAQRRPVFRSRPIYDQADGDRLVGGGNRRPSRG